MTMPVTTTLADPPKAARLRSGTAARLAGLPVTTLRVWERRYGVVAAPKTVTGQRLYSNHDVQRLGLLKQLTDRGHAIGTIATLDLEPLQALVAGVPSPALIGVPINETVDSRVMVVVGRSAAQRLKPGVGCRVRAVHDDLDHAEAATEAEVEVENASASASSVMADVLLVHLQSLQPASAQRVLALGAALHAGAIVVLYAFGTEAIAESLRSAGVTVRREPIAGRELARLIAATRNAAPSSTANWHAAPRRFSDETLMHLTELPSSVACECPRHVAEIVMQLASFERYSEDCTTRSPADAALHRHLSGLAGAARSLFEQALERVVVDEGIELAMVSDSR